jgi:hypothetical protein
MLTTGRSTRRKTLLLVGDMRGAVVVVSALFLQKFLLALQKFGFVACRGANKLLRGVFGTSQRVLICLFMGGVSPPLSICLTIAYFAVHKLVFLNTPTRKASDTSCKARTAVLWNCGTSP